MPLSEFLNHMVSLHPSCRSFPGFLGKGLEAALWIDNCSEFRQ